jgi:hypothetical protein
MTDPLDFEPRLEGRLVAYAARATRPFDAAAIAAAAAAPTRSVFTRSWVRPLMGRGGRISILRAAVAMGLLAVAVTAGAILVGSAFRSWTPRPDHLAIAPPAPSAEAVAPTAPPSTSPTADPSPTPTIQPPTVRSDLLALIRRGSKHCGEVVTTIDVVTGSTQDRGSCANVTEISPDGTRAIIGGGTNVDDPEDPENWLASGDPNRFEVVGLRDGTSVSLDTSAMPAFTDEARGYVSWSPHGRWIVRQDSGRYWIRSSDLPLGGGSGWTELQPMIGTPGITWSPDDTHFAIRTAAGLVIGDGSGTDLRALEGIPWISSWSEDGSRIAFPHPNAFEEVWVGNADGSDQAQVSDRGGTIQLSSDGRQIAVLEGGHLLRWRLADGTWREVALPVNLDCCEPAIQWTADEDGLIVSARNDPDANGGPGHTFLISIDGTLLAQVDGSDPAWSPDRTRFAVSVSPDDLDPNGTTAPVSTKARGTVYLVESDGTTVRVKDAYSPAWSPDGSSIAVLTGDPVATGIAVLTADGTGRHAVPNVPLNGAGALTWVP